MIIKALVENTSISKDLGCEHGLSLYIEANARKILFDVGASEMFIENAQKMDVDITEIDYLIISHGHYDHGGGLRAFLRENTKARVFIHHLAFDKHYALRSNDKLDFIGLEKELKENKQIIFTSDQFIISNGIHVFSNVVKRETLPLSNSGLLMEKNGQMIKDNFAHEQNLIIEDAGKIFLITGCAHNGIVNILEYFHTLQGRMPDYVIGGFHLSGHSGGHESLETIKRIGKYLNNTKAQFYTCHCTGTEAYKQLKEVMGDSIDYLSVGSVIYL